MKVLCVTNKHHVNPNCPMTEVGSEYTVVGQRCKSEGLYYELLEFPRRQMEKFEEVFLYHSKGFAIPPTVSEEIATEHEQEAIIYQR